MHRLITSRPAFFLRVCLICTFLFQVGCATISQQPKTQPIRVTSNPPGAQIFVNGEPISATPAKIELTKKNVYLIRIEKEGYAPYEVKMKRGYNKSVLLNLLSASLLGWFNYSFLYLSGQNNRETSFVHKYFLGHDPKKGRTFFTFMAPFVFTAGLSIGIDRLTGAGFKQRPSQIRANLSKPNK